VEERVQSLAARLLRAVRFQQMHAQQRFARVAATSTFARMRDSIGRRQQRVDQDRFRLEAATANVLLVRAARLRTLTELLQRQDMHRKVLLAQARNERLRERLNRTGAALLQLPKQRVARAETRLQALSPTAVLQRGYALVFNTDGRLLRSADEAHAGEEIRTRLGKGELRSRVLSNNENDSKTASSNEADAEETGTEQA
jgi:exodeoxyribonuclease VII large subunit